MRYHSYKIVWHLLPPHLGSFNLFIIKNIFIKSLRYQFLVYNASVIYFNYIRPFFRDGYRKYLCDSFQQVVDTLRNIDNEQDFPWQAELLLYALIFFFFNE
jgi:hypothetical protein